MRNLIKLSLAMVLLFVIYSPAMAVEKPIGMPETQNGMEIAAVYLQPIEMSLQAANKP